MKAMLCVQPSKVWTNTTQFYNEASASEVLMIHFWRTRNGFTNELVFTAGRHWSQPHSSAWTCSCWQTLQWAAVHASSLLASLGGLCQPDHNHQRYAMVHHYYISTILFYKLWSFCLKILSAAQGQYILRIDGK